MQRSHPFGTEVDPAKNVCGSLLVISDGSFKTGESDKKSKGKQSISAYTAGADVESKRFESSQLAHS